MDRLLSNIYTEIDANMLAAQLPIYKKGNMKIDLNWEYNFNRFCYNVLHPDEAIDVEDYTLDKVAVYSTAGLILNMTEDIYNELCITIAEHYNKECGYKWGEYPYMY